MLVGRFHFSLSKKAILLVGIFVILLIAVPLTVYIVQQQQQTQSSAAPATTLSFTTSTPATVQVGEQVSVDIMVNPDTNVVKEILFYLSYDPDFIEPVDNGFVGNDSVLIDQLGFSVYRNPTAVNGIISAGYTLAQAQTGNTSANLGIKTPTKIGTLTFTALQPGTTTLSFSQTEPTRTFIKSGGTSDTAPENALAQALPGQITIVAPEETATPTPSATESATPTPTPSEPASSPVGEAPVCSSLGADVTDGSAPLAITFTANGSDSDGSVDKITFDYGDGNTEDVTEGGGLGTDTVNTQVSHTYTDAGTYDASAVLTDSDLNASEACSQTITVSTAEGSQVAEATPSSSPLPATGPGGAIVGVGILGAILTGIGILLFLAL